MVLYQDDKIALVQIAEKVDTFDGFGGTVWAGHYLKYKSHTKWYWLSPGFMRVVKYAKQRQVLDSMLD